MVVLLAHAIRHRAVLQQIFAKAAHYIKQIQIVPQISYRIVNTDVQTMRAMDLRHPPLVHRKISARAAMYITVIQIALPH